MNENASEYHDRVQLLLDTTQRIMLQVKLVQSPAWQLMNEDQRANKLLELQQSAHQVNILVDGLSDFNPQAPAPMIHHEGK